MDKWSEVGMFLGMMISLYLQQRYDAFSEIVILSHAGAVLLISTIEKLATIVAIPRLENDEVATLVVLPVYDRAGSEFTIRRHQADFRIRILDFHIMAIALAQGGFNDPLLSIGDIRDFTHNLVCYRAKGVTQVKKAQKIRSFRKLCLTFLRNCG